MRSSVRRLTGSGIGVPPRSGVNTQPLVRGTSDLVARSHRSRTMHAEHDVPPTVPATSLDISRRAPTSLLTCDDGGEGPHLLVIALVEGSARIVAGQQRGQAPFDNFVRLLVKYRG